MAKAHLKVHMGGIATAIEFYQSAPTPNLILLESRSEPKQLLEQLAQLSEYCDPDLEGRGDRPLQRCRALPRTHPLRYFRICHRAGVDGRHRQRGFVDLRRSGSRADRPLDRLHRRQGRRRLLDHRPQCGLGDVVAVQVGSGRRRSRPGFRHGQHQFRPGSGAGHRRGGVLARAHRRGLSRPPAGPVRRASVAACGALDARAGLRLRSRRLHAAHRHRAAQRCRCWCSTSRMSGPAGPRTR